MNSQGGNETFDDMEGGDILARLPELLRSLACPPDSPWVDPSHHDHGHTGCYFINLAADEIEDLRRTHTAGES